MTGWDFVVRRRGEIDRDAFPERLNDLRGATHRSAAARSAVNKDERLAVLAGVGFE